MQIYIHRNDQQLGPFTQDEITAQFNTNAISVNDHVWWQGQADWMPLGKSPLAAVLIQGADSVPSNTTVHETSQFAIWALVCGCLSLLCGFLAIPAIIFGHLSLSDIKGHPTLKGRGMAIAGMIIGYAITTLIVTYLAVALMIAGKAIRVPVQTTLSTNSADESTNAPVPSAPTPATTNSPDQSTNSLPAVTNAPDQSTNSADSNTNNSAPNTNAPDSGTNAAPMNP